MSNLSPTETMSQPKDLNPKSRELYIDIDIDLFMFLWSTAGATIGPWDTERVKGLITKTYSHDV
jgi:hypothetical protein